MLERHLITDFSLGQITERMAARLDLPARVKGVEYIEGFLIHPDGGLRRRPGTVYVRTGLGISPAADGLYADAGIPAFIVFAKNNARWLGFIQDATPDEFHAIELDGTGDETIGDASIEIGTALYSSGDYTNPADDTEHIQIWTPGDAFKVALATWSLSRPSQYDLALVFQNRLIGVKRATGEIVMSVPLVLTDFDTANGALEATPDFYGTEAVRWLVARQSVYLGTARAEHEIYSNFPFFSEELGGLQLQKIGDVGAEQAIYFGAHLAVRSRDRITLFQYSGEGFTYQSSSLTELLDNVGWVTMEVVEYGTHRYLLGVDFEGSLFAYLMAPGSEVRGWVTVATGVHWIHVYDKDLYAAVLRDGAYYLEVFPLDTLFHPDGRTERQHQTFAWTDRFGEQGGWLTLTSASLSGDTLPPSATVTVYEVTSAGCTLIGDHATDVSGALDDTLANIKTFTGWTSGEQYLYCHLADTFPSAQLRTLPLTQIIGQPHTVAKVVVQVVDSMAFDLTIEGLQSGDGKTTSWTSATPFTGPVTIRVDTNADEEVRIRIEAVDALPLSVMQIYAIVEVGGTE